MHEWLKFKGGEKKRKRKKKDLSGLEEMVLVFGKGNRDAIKWPHQAISSFKQKIERD